MAAAVEPHEECRRSAAPVSCAPYSGLPPRANVIVAALRLVHDLIATLTVLSSSWLSAVGQLCYFSAAAGAPTRSRIRLAATFAVTAAGLALLSGCGGHKTAHQKVPPPPTVKPAQPPEVANTENPAYNVPRNAKPIYVETGLASWYGPPYNHRKGANGEIYDQNAMTAAHRTLPLNSMVRVTNLSTGPRGHGADHRPRTVYRGPRD